MAKVSDTPATTSGGGFLDDLPGMDAASQFLRVLYFGQEGTGKSSSSAFMANTPGEGVVLAVSMENGLKLGPLKQLGVNVDSIKLWPPDPTRAANLTYEDLDKLYFQCANQLRKAPGSIKGVIFDTWSVASYALLEGAAEFQVERSKRGNNPRESARAIELQDYNTLLKDCRDIINKFAGLPCHLAIVCQEADNVPGEGEFKGFKQYAADVAGSKSRPLMYAAVDQAIRLTAETVVTGDTESEILVEGYAAKSKTLRVKDRFHVLPPVMPEPRFDRLLEYYQGTVLPSTDPVFGLYAKTREQAAEYAAEKKNNARNRGK